MKKSTIIAMISAVILLLGILWIAFCGFQWSWGPFAKLHDFKTAGLPGNAAEYEMSKVPPLDSSPLNGKQIIFLGSSVTYGAASKGVSFADYIGVRNGCQVIKEAVSGTTLVDNGSSSYISRLKKMKVPSADLFVCQLSTNDATQKKMPGEISQSRNMEDFDTTTVAGAMEYIIAYAREKWNCPVVFYTNPKYDSDAYGNMVALLLQIADKWDISVIDLWNDTEFNNISQQERELYLADAIHPTQAGYLEWWTPRMEADLYRAAE